MKHAEHRRGPILSSSFVPSVVGYVIYLVDMTWHGVVYIEIVGCAVGYNDSKIDTTLQDTDGDETYIGSSTTTFLQAHCSEVEPCFNK